MGTDKQDKRLAESEEPPGFWRAVKYVDKGLAIIVSIITVYQAVFGSSESSGNAVSLEDSSNQGVVGQITSENNNGQSINLVAGDGARIVVHDSETQALEENVAALDDLTIAVSTMTPDEKLAFSSDRLRIGEYAQALHVLSAMLAEDTTDAQLLAAVYYNRGLAHFHLGEYAQAQLDFEQAIGSNEFPDGYYNLGVVHHSVYSEYGQAISAYSKALESGDNVVYRLARAVAYEKDGQYQAAQQDYLAVLDAEPQNAAALEGTARVTQIS